MVFIIRLYVGSTGDVVEEHLTRIGLALPGAGSAGGDVVQARLRRFQEEHKETVADALESLKEVALSGGNIFSELLHTVRHASLGQISSALYEVGGSYRRNS